MHPVIVEIYRMYFNPDNWVSKDCPKHLRLLSGLYRKTHHLKIYGEPRWDPLRMYNLTTTNAALNLVKKHSLGPF